MNTDTLGTQANADVILAHVNKYTHIDSFEFPLPPEGFKFLGQGWSRVAFLGPDNVVYKVARPHNENNRFETVETAKNRFRCSLAEARLFGEHGGEVQHVEDAGFAFRFAACRLLGQVIAMEYVPKSPKTATWNLLSRVESLTGLIDMHNGNAWYDPQGVLVIVDYGEDDVE